MRQTLYSNLLNKKKVEDYLAFDTYCLTTVESYLTDTPQQRIYTDIHDITDNWDGEHNVAGFSGPSFAVHW